jgi:hypothetical protein
MLGRLARLPSQRPDAELAGHHVPDPHHCILDVVDIRTTIHQLFFRQ